MRPVQQPRHGRHRRTFFGYFSSKNDAVWGEFEQGLHKLRDALATADRRRPLLDALREAVLALNALSPAEEPWHGGRTSLILQVPALQAHSTLRYAARRAVVAQFAADRLGLAPSDPAPATGGAQLSRRGADGVRAVAPASGEQSRGAAGRGAARTGRGLGRDRRVRRGGPPDQPVRTPVQAGTRALRDRSRQADSLDPDPLGSGASGLCGNSRDS